MQVIEIVSQPWKWYIGGALIGLMVPALLILSNKQFGVSSSLRHLCAATLPGKVAYFRYDWKSEGLWNILFVFGIVIGSYVASHWLHDPQRPYELADQTRAILTQYGIDDFSQVLPGELFSWATLLTPRGFILIVVGGFLVGFGTRYADGCTSGHSIMGMSNLQPASLLATIFFFIGGLIMTHGLLPFILRL
jgi:uncharacterized membrane protein YedE/YeeE